MHKLFLVYSKVSDDISYVHPGHGYYRNAGQQCDYRAPQDLMPFSGKRKSEITFDVSVVPTYCRGSYPGPADDRKYGYGIEQILPK